MKLIKSLPKIHLLLCLIIVPSISYAAPTPPVGQKWQPVPELTDDFNSFDNSKWQKGHPYWSGRSPSKFNNNNLSWVDGKMRIQATLKNANRTGDFIWTGCLTSKEKSFKEGMYAEARVKNADIAIVSSFWMQEPINSEIDVIENWGEVYNPRWKYLEYTMEMNTHYFPGGFQNDKATPRHFRNPGNVGNSAEYAVYGVWWVDKRTVRWYRNGVEVASARTEGNFNNDMFMFFDMEAFTWGPGVASNADLNNPNKNYAYYDYVKTYRLVPDNAPPNPPSVKDVPGMLEAENYNRFSDATMGNEGGKFRNDDVDIESTTDDGGGYNVGWIDAGEWLEYNINVTQSGSYKATARVASEPGNGSFLLQIDGNSVGSTVNVPATGGWQNWNFSDTAIGNLSTGNHTLRFQVQNGGFNLNWIDIRLDGTSPTPTDQCNTTQQCKDLFGDQATDCANSASDMSVCMCGNSPC